MEPHENWAHITGDLHCVYARIAEVEKARYPSASQLILSLSLAHKLFDQQNNAK